MLSWLTYCLLVSLLLGFAAAASERSARAVAGSTRWWWALALLGGVLLPAWAWLAPASVDSGSLGALPVPGAYVMELVPVPVAAAPDAGADRFPGWGVLAVSAWAAVSLSLLLFVAVSLWRLHRQSGRWRRAGADVLGLPGTSGGSGPGVSRLAGVEVLVTPETGPAALGLLRGRILIPEWVLRLEPGRRDLLLLHEAEHVRARDPQLALAGLVLCALMPWNPLLWWQLSRLRLAIEMDCDARVLRASRDVRGYGSLLLEVGQRRARLAVALAESRS